MTIVAYITGIRVDMPTSAIPEGVGFHFDYAGWNGSVEFQGNWSSSLDGTGNLPQDSPKHLILVKIKEAVVEGVFSNHGIVVDPKDVLVVGLDLA